MNETWFELKTSTLIPCMLNHNLFKKLKRIERDKFNYLINTLIVKSFESIVSKRRVTSVGLKIVLV
jgi:hypothetical protein